MTIRLLRGQVVVRETTRPSDVIWTPKQDVDQVRTHRGIVLAKGPPCLIWNKVGVPHGFEIGDEVIYHFVHHELAHTRLWEDGKMATWIPQACVDGVIERA